MPHQGRRGDGEVAASLTGGGPSQVGVSGAMRARDVSRPDDDDVATAERLVQVSRRPPRARPGPPPARGGRGRPADTAQDTGGSTPDRS
jgi:hypothetical protein